MARKDKILDVMALGFLDEGVRIARLAHKHIGQSFPLAQARAVIDCYFDPSAGMADVLAMRLYKEKLRQERLFNDRAAIRTAAEIRAEPPMRHYDPQFVGDRNAAKHRATRRVQIAKRIFGEHVSENFNEDTLALMSLLNGDVRHYRVEWLEGSSQPVPSALIQVTTQIIGGTVHERTFLLYKVGERVLVARADKAKTTRDAYAMQLPRSVVENAAQLQADGFVFVSDLEGQQMVITAPDGQEKIVEWTGRTVDE